MLTYCTALMQYLCRVHCLPCAVLVWLLLLPFLTCQGNKKWQDSFGVLVRTVLDLIIGLDVISALPADFMHLLFFGLSCRAPNQWSLSIWKGACSSICLMQLCNVVSPLKFTSWTVTANEPGDCPSDAVGTGSRPLIGQLRPYWVTSSLPPWVMLQLITDKCTVLPQTAWTGIIGYFSALRTSTTLESLGLACVTICTFGHKCHEEREQKEHSHSDWLNT